MSPLKTRSRNRIRARVYPRRGHQGHSLTNVDADAFVVPAAQERYVVIGGQLSDPTVCADCADRDSRLQLQPKANVEMIRFKKLTEILLRNGALNHFDSLSCSNKDISRIREHIDLVPRLVETGFGQIGQLPE